MASQRSAGEEVVGQELEPMSVPKRLVRSMSQKMKRKSQKHESSKEDEINGVSLRCLTLYGRGGGCRVSADIDEEPEDLSSRRRSSASEDGKGKGSSVGKESSIAKFDCFSIRMERFFRRNNRKLIKFKELEQSNSMNARIPDDILEMCLVRLPLASLFNARLVCKKWRYLTTSSRFMQIRREGSFQSSWLFPPSSNLAL